MGYESKVIIVDRNPFEGWTYGDEIARFDLSKMGYERVNGFMFREIFKNEIDFDLFYTGVHGEEDNVRNREDMYGDTCCWAEVEDVIEWLENSETGKEYRRAKLLLDFLKVLEEHEDEWEQLVVVHFGY